MKKALLVGIFAAALLAAPAQADNIGGVEFDIPSDWSLFDSQGENMVKTNYYISGSEVVIIMVADASFLGEGQETLANLYLGDCESLWGRNEGYYLMSDITDESDEGYKTLLQECVYNDNGWKYVYLTAANTGTAGITMVYHAPTLSEHTQFDEFSKLSNYHILDYEG